MEITDELHVVVDVGAAFADIVEEEFVSRFAQIILFWR